MCYLFCLHSGDGRRQRVLFVLRFYLFPPILDQDPHVPSLLHPSFLYVD